MPGGSFCCCHSTGWFATIVCAGDFTDAANRLLVDFRTALHAAGHSTAGWPRLEPTDHEVRELQGT